MGPGGQRVLPPRLSFLIFTLRAADLESEVARLREKIHHLDDMLKSQQRKVRQMIEQVRRPLSPGSGCPNVPPGGWALEAGPGGWPWRLALFASHVRPLFCFLLGIWLICLSVP